MNTQIFLDHFERLTDAPNAVARLRELVLQLAMQGKLVEQDERDEPAARLLERIEAERKRLVREKKIREAKPLPPVLDDEAPFELPNGWAWSRLAVIADWAIGSGFPLSVQGHTDKPYLFCKVSDMNLPGNEVQIKETQNRIDDEIAKKISARIHPPGTVIFPKIGGAIATNKRRVLAQSGAIDNNCLGLIPNGVCSSQWLHLLLTSIDFAQYQTGTSVPALSQGTIGLIVTGVPPLEEQKRIVAKVDELMRLCDELERAQDERREARQRLTRAALDQLLAARDAAEFQARWQTVRDHFPTLTAAPDLVPKLRQTVLQLAVQGKLTRQDPQDEPAPALLRRIRAERERLVKEKILKEDKSISPVHTDEIPFNVPSSWVWCRLVDICILITDGKHGDCNNQKDSGYYFLSAKDIVGGKLRYERARQITKEDFLEVHRRTNLEPDDILISNAGSIGKTAIAANDEKTFRTTFQKSVAIVKPFKQFIDSKYLALYCVSSLQHLEALSRGGAQKNLLLGHMKRLPIALPPREEQKRIVAAVNRLKALCDELEAGLRRTEEDGERLLRAAVRSLLAPTSKNLAEESAELVVQ
jgi:type I restriction enzyme S subunit